MGRMQSWWRTNLFALPSTITRFVLIFPWAIYYSYTQRHWKMIRENPELHAGLYSPLIVKGERIAAQWGRIGFFYNFSVAIPALVMSVPFSLIFGFFDLIIAIFISVATHFQTLYVPHSLNACKGGGAHTFQVPRGTNESLFDLMGRLNATAVPGEKFCNAMVQEWQFGLSLSVIYTSIAFTNVCFCILIFIRRYRTLHYERKSFRAWFLETALELPRYTYFCICGLVYLFLIFPFRFLPVQITWPTRLAKRYAAKTTQRVPTPHQIKIKMSTLTGRHQTALEKMYCNNGEPINQTPLASFLSIYDILILVTGELHYNDINALSRTSKSVREALFPSINLSPLDCQSSNAQRLAHFRLYTCDPLSKDTCYLCAAQICGSCQKSRALKLTNLPWHLDNCVPYCRVCYATSNKSDPSYRLQTPRCNCAPPDEKARFLDYLAWGGPNKATYFNWQYVARTVCKMCDVMLDSEIAVQRMARTKAELKDPQREGIDRCGGGRRGSGCGKLLESGVRWWGCKGCKKECTKSCHVSWTKTDV
ncbi:hypothetical protein B0J11DRAFT_27387 [Dendryphion nanum]|uniref:Uncharacterized protein n=1 Tax=Dendryphion nanum TaxID=256645 RepID=A0A9P9EL26_9PLEO|nr:hypothetical protein B0J11DRAFT_27387 [Dendryphion nanum]